jgi:hypothetical protein
MLYFLVWSMLSGRIALSLDADNYPFRGARAVCPVVSPWAV